VQLRNGRSPQYFFIRASVRGSVLRKRSLRVSHLSCPGRDFISEHFTSAKRRIPALVSF